MTLLQQDYENIANRLREVERDIQRFTACTSDWSARLLLQQDMAQLCQHLRNFARYQYGMQFTRQHKETT